MMLQSSTLTTMPQSFHLQYQVEVIKYSKTLYNQIIDILFCLEKTGVVH